MKKNLKPLLSYIEKILRKRGLRDDLLKDEFEKTWFCFIDGNDTINTYERRSAGISDKEWDDAVLLFKKVFN